MNETWLRTIEQIEQFLSAGAPIEFSAVGDDSERYAHISRVPKRFDYPGRNKRERGLLRKYLQHTSGYSRAQVTRLLTQWHHNRLADIPLTKRYRAPAASFARKYTARWPRQWPRSMSRNSKTKCCALLLSQPMPTCTWLTERPRYSTQSGANWGLSPVTAVGWADAGGLERN